MRFIRHIWQFIFLPICTYNSVSDDYFSTVEFHFELTIKTTKLRNDLFITTSVMMILSCTLFYDLIFKAGKPTLNDRKRRADDFCQHLRTEADHQDHLS